MTGPAQCIICELSVYLAADDLMLKGRLGKGDRDPVI